MHVLFLHLYFNPPEGSGSDRQARFVRRLVARGHRVTVVSGIDVRAGGLEPGTRERDGFRLHVVDVRYAQALSIRERVLRFSAYNRRAERFARRLDDPPDLVFATSTPLTIGLPGYRLAARFGVPFVFEVRDLWPDVPIELGLLSGIPARVARRLERRVYTRADHVIALSPGIAEGIARTAPEAEITLIPNGSDLARFDPEGRAADLRDRLGWTDRVVALYAGALGWVNGLDLLLDAAARLRTIAPAVQIVLLGEGAERPALEARARALDLPNVAFLDPVPKPELPRYWQAADIGLTVFRPEPVLQTNSANKFFDTLAAGRPAVVTQPGWQADWLARYDAGCATTPGDPGHLADTLAALAADADRRAHLGRNARRLAEEHFDAARQADTFVDVLERVKR